MLYEPRTGATSADDVNLWPRFRGPEAVGQLLTTIPGDSHDMSLRRAAVPPHDSRQLDPVAAALTRPSTFRPYMSFHTEDQGEAPDANLGLRQSYPARAMADPLQGEDEVPRQANTFRLPPEEWDRAAWL